MLLQSLSVKLVVEDFPENLSGTLEGYIAALNRARRRIHEELLVVNSIPIKPMPHQIEVAKKVIYDMDCRAILGDEVGLGKTIEAGLILKEKILRDEVSSALILAPASLVQQWKTELEEKFNMNFSIATSPEEFLEHFVIASIHLAKRERYRNNVVGRSWDMVVVDEAHHVRNPKTQNYRLLRELNSKFMLLLTATPVSNSLKEIYYLGDLLRPGIFGTYREFESQYFSDKKGQSIKNQEELKRKLSEIMVRNRRRDVFVDFTERVVKTHVARMDGKERALYDLILDFLRSEENKLRVISYAKAATSSPRTVAKMAWKALKREKNLHGREALLKIYRAAMDSPFTKLELLEKVAESVEGGVIFTTYLETMREIDDFLQDSGYHVLTYHGGMSREEKSRTIEEFKKKRGFLIATDSGGEGLNLQFENVMINFDLPWNPMKVEQRIGRIHRIGQVRDVYVVNLAYEDTIEEHILWILDRKINLFRSVVGEVDAILGSLERNFESIIADIIMSSRDREDIATRLDMLGDDLEKIRSRYERSMELNDSIFSQFNLGIGGV